MELPAGSGIDVRPHPHIGLATVTYLFEGELIHRDSVGSLQAIRAGDVNWMIAGRGIVHSERSAPEARRQGARLHGIQSWVAVPAEREEDPPSFEHHEASTLPRVARDGASVDVIAGTAYGERSPVSVPSPTLYVHARLDAGARLGVDDGHEERAVYLVEGEVALDDRVLEAGSLAVLRPGVTATIEARAASRVMMVGGARLSGERHIDWNFVSSSQARIERARADWQAERSPLVPGDEHERIPLPSR
jgi:redox-sensitive bicupin YhaK (pirin superfamily)